MVDNKTLFDKYYQINSVQKEFEEESDYKICNDVCRAFHLCSISEQDYDRFDNCIVKYSSSGASAPKFTISFVSAILIGLFFSF